jgi:hypothetical protein
MPNIGTSVSSTTERIAKATTYSRTPRQAEQAGPIGRPSTPGRSAAIVSGGARGVLRQQNIGDVQSPVDQLGDANKQASRAKSQQRAAETAAQFKAQISGTGGGVNKSA